MKSIIQSILDKKEELYRLWLFCMPKMKGLKENVKKVKVEFMFKIFLECFSELEVTNQPILNLHLALIKQRLEPDFDFVIRSLHALQGSEHFGTMVQITVSELMLLGDSEKAAHVLQLWLLNKEIPLPPVKAQEVPEQEPEVDEIIKEPDFVSAKNQERQSDVQPIQIENLSQNELEVKTPERQYSFSSFNNSEK